MSHNYRLIVSCPDRVGIVSRVSGFIAAQNGSIVEANQHLSQHVPSRAQFWLPPIAVPDRSQ